MRRNRACTVGTKSKSAIFEPFADDVKRLEKERKTLCDDLGTTLSIFMRLGIKLYKVECQKHFQAKYAVHLHFRAKHTLILCCHFLNKSSSLVVKSPFDKEKRVFKPLCSVSPILSHVRRPRTFPLILHSTLQVYYVNNFLWQCLNSLKPLGDFKGKPHDSISTL